MNHHMFFVFAVVFLDHWSILTAQEPAQSDPVKEYRRQVEVLRESYIEKTLAMEKSKAELATKFKELATAYRDDAVAKLNAMTKDVQATDLDEAIRLRDIASELKQEPIAEADDSKSSSGHESKLVQRMRAEIEQLKLTLDKVFRLDEQLLVNASFEEIPQSGTVTGWISKSGDWRLGVNDSQGTRPAHGNAFLNPGTCAFGQLIQNVDISTCAPIVDEGQLDFQLSCVVKSFRQSQPDTCEMLIEFLDNQEKILKSFTTGKQAFLHAWTPVSLSDAIPALSRTIRVTLLSKRHGGRQNNGYFDNAQLIITNRNAWGTK